MQWTNDALPLLVNSMITEYDIKSGNTSIIRENHLFPEPEIQRLEKMSKKDRLVEVGMKMRESKEFSKALEAGFTKAVDQFVNANQLDKDVDILAIRRDAVFVVNRPIQQESISPNVTFRPKNRYHAFILVGKYEFYFGEGDVVDIKGFIGEGKDTNGAIEKLKPGPVAFLQELIQVAESTNFNRALIYKWIEEFMDLYKRKALDFEYYRQFDRDAMFRIVVNGEPMYSDFVTEDLLPDLDISFNYTNIIIPVLRVLV